MILNIIGCIIGLFLVYVGWTAYCLQSMSDNPPSQSEIELLRQESFKATEDDRPLKSMYLADAEAEYRRSLEPKIKWGKAVLALGIGILILSIANFF